jgi:uncharacterized protein YjbJ (UPF0337 family)
MTCERREMAPGPSTTIQEDRIMEDRKRDLAAKGDENRLRGAGNDLKGRVKDAAGGLTNDNEMQAEGKWDKLKGKAQDAVGDIQQRLGRDEPNR